MLFLWRKPKEVKADRKPKRPPKSLNQILNDTWLNELKRNPKLGLKVAAKRAGDLDLLIEPDPIEQKRQEIKDVITAQALNDIKGDPELRGRFARRQVEELIGEKLDDERGNDNTLPAFSDDLETFERVSGWLENHGGGNKGGIGSLLTPEVARVIISELIAPLVIARGGQLPQLPQPTKYVRINKDDTETEMNPSQYMAYLEAKERKRLAQPEITKEEPGKVASEVPEEAPSINLSELVAYIEEEPSVFVEVLRARVAEGDTQAQFVLNIFMQNSADEILKLLQPFKGQHGEEIGILEDNKEWLEEVIRIVRDETEELEEEE